MERGKRFIYFLTLFLIIFSPLLSFGEYKEYKGIKIPKFPAPRPPESFEPPDWRNYPWFPSGKEERFDINQPQGVEKMMWIVRNKLDAGWCSHGGAFLMDQNRFGHVRRLLNARAALFYYDRDYKDLLSYHEGKVKAGDVEFKEVIYMNEPPQIRALQNLAWKYLETPAAKKEQDRWVYVPALRRTRRLAAGADDDKLAGTDTTVDDVGSNREVWEEEYVLLGEDQLGPEEHSFLSMEPKGPFAKYIELAYRPKVFNCWVIATTNRKPRYYIPFRVLWIDKVNHIIVREEQYDFHGNLWKIYDKTSRNYKDIADPNGPPDRFYWGNNFLNVWDVKIDHRTFVHIFNIDFDVKTFLKWRGKGAPPASFFDVKRLEREEWGEKLPKAPTEFRTLDEYVPRPKLLRDRFKQFRKIILPEELEKKLIEEYGE